MNILVRSTTSTVLVQKFAEIEAKVRSISGRVVENSKLLPSK